MLACYVVVCALIQDGYTALHLAAVNGHVKVVDHLVSQPSQDVNKTNNVSSFIVFYSKLLNKVNNIT